MRGYIKIAFSQLSKPEKKAEMLKQLYNVLLVGLKDRYNFRVLVSQGNDFMVEVPAQANITVEAQVVFDDDEMFSVGILGFADYVALLLGELSKQQETDYGQFLSSVSIDVFPLNISFGKKKRVGSVTSEKVEM